MRTPSNNCIRLPTVTLAVLYAVVGMGRQLYGLSRVGLSNQFVRAMVISDFEFQGYYMLQVCLQREIPCNNCIYLPPVTVATLQLMK